MYSCDNVKQILDTVINTLIDNFMCEPYLHRCEHSIHCELYRMLSACRVFQGAYKLKGDEERSTTLIHKEWPETIARPENDGRRGNFDLAILSPNDISESTVSDFTSGRITPDFVVEMGLNYPLEHLLRDIEKLKNSNCEKGYLIHLWQPHKGIKDAAIEQLQEIVNTISSSDETNLSVAAVVFTSSNLMVKHIGDSEFKLNNRK